MNPDSEDATPVQTTSISSNASESTKNDNDSSFLDPQSTLDTAVLTRTTESITSSPSTRPAPSKDFLASGSTSDSPLSDTFPASSLNCETHSSDETSNLKSSESSQPDVTNSNDFSDLDSETSENVHPKVLGSNALPNTATQEWNVTATSSAPFTRPSMTSPSPLQAQGSPWSLSSRLSNISTASTPRSPYHIHPAHPSGSMAFAPSSHPPSPSPSSPSPLPSSPSPNPRPRLLFPRVLTKPQVKSIQPEVISALDADLKSVPLPYIINTLKRLGPSMMAVLVRTSAIIPALGESNGNEKTTKPVSSLPRELPVTISLEPAKDATRRMWFHDRDNRENENNVNADFDTLPTHLLAVYSRSPVKAWAANPHESTNNGRRKVTLFPTHGIVLAAHCAYLPALPPGRKITVAAISTDSGRRKTKRDMKRHFGVNVPESIPESESECNGEVDNGDLESNHQHGDDDDNKRGVNSTLTGLKNGVSIEVILPVVPLCIPSPGTFPILQAYLYTKRTDRLLAALVPAIPSSDESMGLSHGYISEFASSPAELSRQLSATFAPNVLLAATLRTHELWANVAALGIFDADVWKVINYAWKVLLGALEVVQMRMKGPEKSVSSQTLQVGDGSHYNIATTTRHVPSSHVLGESPTAPTSQSGLISLLSSSSSSSSQTPLKEGQEVVDEQG